MLLKCYYFRILNLKFCFCCQTICNIFFTTYEKHTTINRKKVLTIFLKRSSYLHFVSWIWFLVRSGNPSSLTQVRVIKLYLENVYEISLVKTWITDHASPTITLNVYAHLMKPVNQEAACRYENMIFEINGSQMVAESKKGLQPEAITPWYFW